MLKTVRKIYNFATVQITHGLIKRNQEPMWREEKRSHTF